MKNYFKIGLLSILIISSIFLITGCFNKVEDNKDTSKKVFNVDQISDKNIKVELSNASKGDEKDAKLVVSEGDVISVESKFEGTNGVTVYYFKSGSKHDKNNADSQLLNGEGNSTTEDFPAGEYDVVFEVEDDNTTGTFEIKVA